MKYFKIILLILIMLVVIFLIIYLKKPICGDGIVEAGETIETCCEDVGCLGEQSCQDHKCIEPNCEECQYQEDYKCKKAICCNDDDCKDSDIYTEDKCINPGIKGSSCEHTKKTCDDSTPIMECSTKSPGLFCGADLSLAPDFSCGCLPGQRLVGNTYCSSLDLFTGSKEILIIEFIQENLEYGEEMDSFNLIDFLNNPDESKYLSEPYFADGYEVYSLNSIPKWFESEAQKYGADLSVSMDIVGPFEVDSNPPERGFYDSCSILNNYFNEELEKNNIDISGYHGVSIMFFQNGDQIFWSCATNKLNYVNVDWVENLNLHTKLPIQTIVHETIHLFGASDKYIGYICQIPNGIPEPNKNPLYPQTKACIMCGKIMTDEDSGGNPDNIKQLVVCDKTAQGIGWTS